MAENVDQAAAIAVAHGNLPSLRDFHQILQNNLNGQGSKVKILTVRSCDVQGLFSSKFVLSDSKINMWLKPSFFQQNGIFPLLLIFLILIIYPDSRKVLCVNVCKSILIYYGGPISLT